MKKKINTPQFPSIYRIITESAVYKNSLKNWNRLPNQSNLKKTLIILFVTAFSILSLILLTGIVVLTKDLYDKAIEINKIIVNRQNIQRQINFWQSVSEKYPGYKDAYFKIAILQYQLGDLESSKKNNNKALLLDPSYDDAKKLEKLLNK